MDKYSVIYKALELACKDLEIVNNPTNAPLNVIMSHYISKAENELCVIDKYKPNSVSSSNVVSQPSSYVTNQPVSEPNKPSNKPNQLKNNYATEIFINNKERLLEVCQCIFNEPNDYNLNYYKKDYLESLDKVISSCRSSKNNPSIDKSILADVITTVVDSLHCAHYRMTSSKEQFDSGVVSMTSNYIHELSLILNSI